MSEPPRYPSPSSASMANSTTSSSIAPRPSPGPGQGQSQGQGQALARSGLRVNTTGPGHSSRPGLTPETDFPHPTFPFYSSSSSPTITTTASTSSSSTATATASRLRANTTLSPPPSTTSTASPYSTHQHHQTRSLSSAPHLASTSSTTTATTGVSPISPGEQRNDVALAVRGLRGMMSSPPPSSVPLSPGNTIVPSSSSMSVGARTTTITSTTPGTGNGGGEGGDYKVQDERTLTRIREALGGSGDEGDTLDLSRQDIRRIGEEAVDMFKSGVGKGKKGVWRLALSYNSLKDGSIVDSFSRLSRLRYLNLKGNYLTQFPQALSDLPALEILDLSKNRITSFPDVPGRLSRLKVLSLTNNKIYTLPSYLVDFTVLKVLKVDGNPIEWPPREVLGPLCDNDAAPRSKTSDSGSVNGGRPRRDEDLRPWIENLKSWMRQRAAESDKLLQLSRTQDDSYLASEEEPSSATSTEPPASAMPWPQQKQFPLMAPSSQETVRRVVPPLKDDSPDGTDSMSRQPLFSQRNRSATRSDDSLVQAISPLRVTHRRDLSTSSFTSPPSASSESFSHSRLPSLNFPQPPPATAMAPTHSRGASFTATQRLSANLTAKKSLPDLRQSHAKIIQDRRQDGQPVEGSKPLGLGIAAPGVPKFQLSGRGSWGADMIKSPSSGPIMTGQERSRALSRKGSADLLRRPSADMGGESLEKRNSQEGPLMDESRNSYFRRLSTLPVSTISKAIPPSLLKFMDAIRGILFALSQLHSALRQYLVFAVNDRISSVFSRVMEPAGHYMNTLINALDRFDSMSRRNTPPVQAIRNVIDATKESVAVFAKVVAVLRLQITALKGNDARYTRTLLLMIYGSMAEVACSWQNMAPLLVEIKPLLATDGMGVAPGFRALGGVKMVPTGSLTGRTPISPIIERRESHSPSSASKSVVGNSPLNQQVDQVATPLPVKLGRSRRQAGSFSSEDVERGMLMGSPSGPRSATGEPAVGELSSASYLRHKPSESANIVLDEQKEEEEMESEDEEEQGEEEEEEATAAEESFSTAGPSNQVGGTTSPRGTPSTTPRTPPEAYPNPPQPVAMVPTTSQSSRRGHHPSSSSGSSHALSLSTGLPHPARKLSVDVRPPTPTSATLFDEDLLDVIETATDIAFTCWLKLAEDVGASTPPFSSAPTHAKSISVGSTSSNFDSSSARLPHPPFTPMSEINPRRPATISAKHHSELLHLLSVAEQITAGLRESLMGLRANPMTTYATTTLPDDAQSFIKTVVKVSEMVKIISANHTFPTNVRAALSRLTQATRECAILIQVSSLRPSIPTSAASSLPVPPTSATSMRSISPMHLTSNSAGGGAEEPPYSAGSAYHIPPRSAGLGSGGGGGGWQMPLVQTSQPRGEGLRGLQLPSRQMALGRSGGRSGNATPQAIPQIGQAQAYGGGG
ncbi:hypothetical protein CI109_100497 [Kwoniella shandongensis]|uniref:Disease resistance R13L4/SHOC-2-like LRR domain-containing protein n=1 Tax=Kwoniella shandongensis TaxID=1734106 RepID=A0A5M6C4J6_9TREE|nr:uncharacterized protein CI109_001660 [Kwoniella shandongensis]KAA5529721.1 hypothetical protein CI109_001660 [Kwoniella shandongensis]